MIEVDDRILDTSPQLLHLNVTLIDSNTSNTCGLSTRPGHFSILQPRISPRFRLLEPRKPRGARNTRNGGTGSDGQEAENGLG